MDCQGCKREAVENLWGAWCDACGGVVVEGAPKQPPKLIFRHVMTVEGAGGRYPIVYDNSAEQYGLAWEKAIDQVKCVHCHQMTPVEPPTGRLEDIRSSRVFSKRGNLNEMIAASQPLAQGNSAEFPEKFAAPTATEEELAIINL